MLSTLAFVIGVSNYSDENIASLPAAQVDAINFARAIRNWGIPESNITLLLNEDAKMETIEEAFATLSERGDGCKLLFYFCGHGFRNPGIIPKSYLLFHDSHVEENECYDGLSLDSLISKISKSRALESYILIDACSLRINSLLNPKLEEEMKGQKISQKSIFCLLSSGIQESFENETERYGYFTESFLKSYSKLRTSDCSPTQLLSDISSEMGANELPLPEMYNIGNHKISFVCQNAPYEEKGLIHRPAIIAKIQDALIQNRGKILCVVGEIGIGKSSICHLLASEKLKTFCLRLPDVSIDLLDYFTILFGEKLSEFEAHFPLIVIDQAERLIPDQINQLCSIISKYRIQFLLITDRYLKELALPKYQTLLVHFEMGPFSRDESDQFMKQLLPKTSENDGELIYLATRGNPLAMRKVAHSLTSGIPIENETGFKQAISAVDACGFYVDKQLFMNQFNIQESTLDCLEELGLISETENGWVPHRFLHEIAEGEPAAIDPQSVLSYLYLQLEALPNHVLTAQSLVVALKCFGYEKKAEKFLKMAFHTLYQKGREHEAFFLDGAHFFDSQSETTESSLILAEILMELGHYERAGKLLEKKSDPDLRKAQLLWRTGKFSQSVAVCSEILKKTKNPTEKLHVHFHRGVSHFLNGNWREASEDFTKVHKTSKDEVLAARAQCMMGTALAIHGSDFAQAKEWLEEGTRLLLKLNDSSGVWSGWNNLGEILWKRGEYKASSFYLDKAWELSQSMHHEGAKLETLRNLLHLHLRISGPFSKRVSGLIDEIEAIDCQKCESFARGQNWNALATAYIFRKNAKSAIFYLKQCPRHEYQTLSNLSLLYKLLKKKKWGEIAFQLAIQLSKKSENFLAVHQLKSDHAGDF